MKYLQKEHLYLVSSKFHSIIQDVWSNGEEVPLGMIYVSDQVPTEKDVLRARELAIQYNWKNV
jgi:hypothetical protein